MDQVVIVHAWLGGPSCQVRLWLCRLGGCARRFREALGQEGWGFLCPSASAVPALAFWRRFVWADQHRPCRARGGPLAGVWRAGTAPSRVCGGLVGLDPRFVSLALVLWCAVVRRAVSCLVAPCCVLLVRAVLQCALLCRAVLRRFVLWCAAMCRVVARCAVVCRVLGCLVVVCCTVVRCVAVCRVASCCAVVGRWRLVRPVLWCGVRVGVWLAGGWGVRLGVGWLAGSLLCGSGCAARAGGSGRCPRGCPRWGPVLWSCFLWGSLPLALGAVAAPYFSSGACVVALAVAGVVAGGEGVVVGCAAVFSAAPSVGVAPSPGVGVPSFPRPSPSWPMGSFLLPCCVPPGALSLWAPACYLGPFLAPLPGCPFPSLALPLPVPFPFPVWW